MARYLVQAASNPTEKRCSPSKLGSWVDQVVGKLGGNVSSLDYTIGGDADLVLLLELPDDATMAAFSELGSSAGKLKVVRVAPLIKPEQACVALERTIAASAELAATADAGLEALWSRPSFVPAAAPAAPEPAEELTPIPETAPAIEDEAAAQEELAPAAVLAPSGDLPPGAYELIAGRFTRFSELAGFSETVQALPGIRGVAIQQFLRGMVSMRIQYESPIALLTRLQELRQFKPVVRATGPAQFEMVIFGESRGGAVPSEPAAETPQPPEVPEPAATPTPPEPPTILRPSGGLLHPALVREAP